MHNPYVWQYLWMFYLTESFCAPTFTAFQAPKSNRLLQQHSMAATGSEGPLAAEPGARVRPRVLVTNDDGEALRHDDGKT